MVGILPTSRGSRSWPCFLFDITLGVTSLEEIAVSTFLCIFLRARKNMKLDGGRIWEDLEDGKEYDQNRYVNIFLK